MTPEEIARRYTQAGECPELEKALAGAIADATADLRTRLAALEGKWQPIDSAPKDGTLLLLHGKDVHQGYRKPPFIGSWSGDWPGDDNCYWRCVTPGLVTEIAPTHWLPLPSPPAALLAALSPTPTPAEQRPGEAKV